MDLGHPLDEVAPTLAVLPPLPPAPAGKGMRLRSTEVISSQPALPPPTITILEILSCISGLVSHKSAASLDFLIKR